MSTDYVKPNTGPRKQANVGASPSGDGTIYGRRQRSAIAWGDLAPDTVGRLVARLCDAGYGIVLGKTSDGGALSVTILDGNDRYKDYPSSADDFDSFVAWCESALRLPSYGKSVGDVPKGAEK